MKPKRRKLLVNTVLALLMPFWLIPVVLLLLTAFLIGAFCANYLTPCGEGDDDALDEDGSKKA
jgi:hypothetical protein